MVVWLIDGEWDLQPEADNRQTKGASISRWTR